MSFFSTPNDKDFDLARAEVSFILDIQMAVQSAMDLKGLNQSDLARLMGVSEARVSQMMRGSGTNMQAKTVGAVAHALHMKPCIYFEEAGAESNCVPMSGWVSRSKNEREAWGRAAAANQNYWTEEAIAAVAR